VAMLAWCLILTLSTICPLYAHYMSTTCPLHVHYAHMPTMCKYSTIMPTMQVFNYAHYASVQRSVPPVD
jgi:hypothetical protein